MLISENGKKLTCNDGNFNHCYLNIKMESGIYRIKYKTTFNGSNRPGFGACTINNYNGDVKIKNLYQYGCIIEMDFFV